MIGFAIRRVLLTVGVFLTVSAAASAYWTASGSGSGSGGVGTLNAPVVTASGTNGTTTIAWTQQASVSGDASQNSNISYTVERKLNGGSYAALATGSCSGTLAYNTTSCIDPSAQTGTNTYRVTANFRTWTATSNQPAVATTDTTPPSVVSISRVTGSTTNATSVQWTVTFSEPVTGVNSTDFGVASVGLSGVSITSVTGSGATYTVTDSTGTGNGTLGLNLVDDDTIKDAAGNKLGGTGILNGNFTGQVYTIDKTAPTVSSINRSATSPTNASSIQFAVTFSESVTGVDPTDFSLAATGVSGASITSVAGSGSSYTVSVDTGTGGGTLGLNLVDNDSVQDGAGNPLGGAGAGNGNFTGQTYTIDKTAPTVSTIARSNPASSATNAASVQFAVTFSESVTGVGATDFSLSTTVTGASIGTVSGSGMSYTVTVDTGSGDGTLRLDVVDDDSIADLAGNKLGGAGTGNGNFSSGQTYTIDKTPPAAPVITSPVNNGSTSTTVNFSGTAEPGSSVTVFDGATAQGTSVTADAAGTWTKQLTGVTSGSHTYTAKATDAVGNTSGSSNTVNVSVDTTAPTISGSTVIKAENLPNSSAGSLRQGGTYYVYVNAADSGSGIASVSANLTAITTGATATLSACSSNCTVNGTTYAFVSALQTANNPLAAGNKSYPLTVTDNVGNQTTLGGGSAPTVTIDNTAPAISSVQAQNGGATSGVLEPADRITFGYSEAIDGSSVLSSWAWPWTATNVQARFTDGGASNDTLRIYTADGSTLLPFGTVDLGATGYVTTGAGTTATFGTVATPTTMTRVTGGTRGFQITLGALSSGSVSSTQVSGNTLTWTPGAGNPAFDAAGNTLSSSPASVTAQGTGNPKTHF